MVDAQTGKRSPAPDDFDPAEQPITPQRGVVRSVSGAGERTTIRFDNRLSESLEYLWVMPDGGLRTYGNVAPNSTDEISTFDGHAWLLRNREGEEVASFVKIDGMGTSHRSKAFHDVCWKNLGDSGFPDRIAWIKAAAATRAEMDLSRVGIWGGSAGGQSAMRALIAHGDFYHAAVADCGCHDNRVDKMWWNEQWMGWPIGPHYKEQSNVTGAHRLKGDLMLIVGELDRNVDPASTMQVVDALVRADLDFELLIMPGVGHGAAGHPYARRRQADFFVRKLWKKMPRHHSAKIVPNP